MSATRAVTKEGSNRRLRVALAAAAAALLAAVTGAPAGAATPSPDIGVASTAALPLSCTYGTASAPANATVCAEDRLAGRTSGTTPTTRASLESAPSLASTSTAVPPPPPLLALPALPAPSVAIPPLLSVPAIPAPPPLVTL